LVLNEITQAKLARIITPWVGIMSTGDVQGTASAYKAYKAGLVTRTVEHWR